MTSTHKLFAALVVQGTLLGGCFEEDPSDTDADSTNQDDTANSTATDPGSDTGEPPVDGQCAEAECANTDSFTDCTADGVLCCWAAGDCCDYCCGDL